MTEGCDDGDLADGDACSVACDPTDVVVGSALRLGRGPHGASASDDGVALALLSDAASPVLSVAFFDGKGHGLGPPELAAPNGVASYLPDPALAPLPDGTFALAYTDVDGDGDALGVALRLVAPGVVPAVIGHANETTAFNQEDPDLIWTGTELVAAWIDTADDPWGEIVVRTFDAQLAPTSDEAVLSGSGESDARPTLASTSGGWAVAWRSSASPWGVEVRTGSGGTWSASPCGPAAIEERPAVVELTAGRLLVVCSQLTDLGPTSSQLRYVVIDTLGADAALATVAVPGPAGSLEATLTKVGSRIVLTQRVATPVGDPLFDEVVWRGVTYDAVADSVDFGTPSPLPRAPAHQAADQLVPVLASSPYWPEGAAFVAWEDWGGVASDTSVLAALVPLPEKGGQP